MESRFDASSDALIASPKKGLLKDAEYASPSAPNTNDGSGKLIDTV
jgi:hypothetical protein